RVVPPTRAFAVPRRPRPSPPGTRRSPTSRPTRQILSSSPHTACALRHSRPVLQRPSLKLKAIPRCHVGAPSPCRVRHSPPLKSVPLRRHLDCARAAQDTATWPQCPL